MGPSLICYQKRNKTNEQDDARRADGGVAVLVLQGQVLGTPTMVLQAIGKTVPLDKEMVVNELNAVLQMTVGDLVALLARHEHCVTSIWSTPKSAGNHAKQIRRIVDNCTTHKKAIKTDSTDEKNSE